MQTVMWNFNIYLIGYLNPIFFLQEILTSSFHKMVVCFCIFIEGGGKLNSGLNFIGTVSVSLLVTTIPMIVPIYLLTTKSGHFYQRFPV